MRVTSGAGKILAVMLAIFALESPLAAEPESAVCEDECVAIGQWQFSLGLGLGLRTNPLRGGQDAPLIVLPDLSYYGERFFLRNLEFGYTLFENQRHQLHALVTPSHDQMYFNRWDPLNVFELGGVANGATTPGLSTSFAPPNTYQVDVEMAPANVSGEVTVGRPESTQQVRIEGVNILYLNGNELVLEPGRYTLSGRAGNRISMEVNSNRIAVTGLSEMDELHVTGDSARFVDGIGSGDVQAGQWPQVSVLPTQSSPGASQVSSRTVPERKLGGLVGLEYMYSLEHFGLHLQALNEFTGLHDGYELRMAGIFPWSWGAQRWALTLGLSYQSRDVIKYYYGLADGESESGALYRPDSGGLTKMVRLDWQKPLTEHWSLRALIQHKILAEEIVHSPLAATDNSTAIFFGGVYHF